MEKEKIGLGLRKPQNINAEWVQSRGVWIMYVVIVLSIRMFLSWTFTDACHAWTIINVGHSLITFLAFHWIKGAPFEGAIAANKWGKYTLWEQIDYGVQWTPTRKFLMFVPIVLFLVTLNCSNALEINSQFLLNFAAFLLATIGKMPFMNKKRILGINAN